MSFCYCRMNLSLPGLSLAHQLYIAVKVRLCILDLTTVISLSKRLYGFFRHKDTAGWEPKH